MRKLIVHQFISLDGVIQAPGGETEDTEGGFTAGGWTRPYWHDSMGAHFAEAMQEADSLVLGRKTWQIHGAVFGPNPAYDPFGDVRKYVASNTLESVDLWPNSTLLEGNVIDAVRLLKNEPGKNLLLDGSSVLVHSLIEYELVDEYLLHVYPLVLGQGKRLFPEGKQVRLKLLEQSAAPTGVVYLRYVPE